MTAKIAVDGLFPPERARYRTFRKLTDHPLALPQETQWMPQRWDSAFVISSKSKVEHTCLNREALLSHNGPMPNDNGAWVA